MGARKGSGRKSGTGSHFYLQKDSVDWGSPLTQLVLVPGARLVPGDEDSKNWFDQDSLMAKPRGEMDTHLLLKLTQL